MKREIGERIINGAGTGQEPNLEENNDDILLSVLLAMNLNKKFSVRVL